MKTVHMPIPVKKSPRSNDAFVTYVKLIVTCLTGNASFPTPTPSVATLADEVNGLAQANATAKGRGPGVVADRDAKRRNLEANVDHLVDYVKGVVRTTAIDPAAATTMILGAGLAVRRNGASPKAPLAARNGVLPGDVKLYALAIAGAAMYFWEYSQDGQTWTSAKGTTRASTTINGLSSGQMYHFRFHAQTAKGPGPDANPVKCRVH